METEYEITLITNHPFNTQVVGNVTDPKKVEAFLEKRGSEDFWIGEKQNDEITYGDFARYWLEDRKELLA